MTVPDSLPSVWRLAWMLFMQPIMIHRQLVAMGVKHDIPGWRLWLAGDIHRQYMVRSMTAMCFALIAIWGLPLAAAAISTGTPFEWKQILFIITFSLLTQILTTVYFAAPISFAAITFTIIYSSLGMDKISIDSVRIIFKLDGIELLSNFFTEEPPKIIFNFIIFNSSASAFFGAMTGTLIGTSAAVDMNAAINKTVSREAPFLIVSAIIIGMIGGVAIGSIYGANIGTSFGAAFISGYLRLIFYPVDLCINFLAWWIQKITNHPTLGYQSILFHDLCYLPLPFLERHILLNSHKNQKQVILTLSACERSPSHRKIYRRITANLEAKVIEESVRLSVFSTVMNLNNQWLPKAEFASQGILAYRDIARYIEAARHASTAHQRQKYLNDAHLELDRLPRVLAEESKERRAALAPIQPIWQEKLNDLRAQADAEAANSVPNPFLTQPLSTASGVEVFVGREDIIRTLDAILADPQQRNSLALLGPRRCGKSSLLRMLPLKLPDAVPVFFDLQDNPATTPAQFFSAIASRAAEQARRERDLVLPKLAPNPDITAFAQWLEQVDTALGSRRLLLCIDEFERLPDLFPGDRRSLLQLMGLFRATVQNRRNIRLLVAGVAPFDELDAIWSDHLINLRELRVEHLDPDSAMRLLTRPIPGFNAIPEPVAREVIARTGCQPLLLQLYGSMLVDRLNAEQRTEATPDDLTAVDRAVREEGNAVNHFRNIYDSAPDEARAVLLALSDASAPSPKLSSATRRYLLRRCFITPEGVPRIPVFFDWVQAEHG